MKVKYWNQFLFFDFAQFIYEISPQDIGVCPIVVPNKQYQIGIKCNIARNTIAEADESMD